jgi:hypothetical protein
MGDVFELVRAICKSPGVYVHNGSFEGILAFLDGYDVALCGGALRGFREWLVVRARGGNNLHWTGLVLWHAFPDGDREKALATKAGQENARRTLVQLFEEYWQVRTEHDGFRKIYLAHEGWLRRQSWYNEGWPGFIPLEWAKARKRPSRKPASGKQRRRI